MSDICHVYEREIRAPIEILLRVEMTDGGLIDHIDGVTYDDMPFVDEMRVVRAVLFLTEVVQSVSNRGDLIADGLKMFPNTPDFEVERSIMTALMELQTDVLSKHIKGRAA